MPDLSAPAHGYWYIDDNATLEEVIAVLVRQGQWFDVRRPRDHKWQICYNPIVDLPKGLTKRLIEVQPAKEETDLNKRAYLARQKVKKK
jgi:hypothetical protein